MIIPSAAVERIGVKFVPMVQKFFEAPRNKNRTVKFNLNDYENLESIMRGVLLWLVGVPIPIIILLYIFHVV